MKNENYMFVRVHYDTRVASLEPLGLEYIMAVVKEEKKNVCIYDESLYSPFFRFQRLLKKIEEKQIGFVGFSIISYTAGYALSVIKKLKAIRPELKIMVGGAEVTVNHQDFMLEEIDYVYYDNGLESLRHAVRNAFDVKALQECTGMAYRKDGRWIETQKGEPISDYGVWPDRSIFYENRKKFRVLAKGCFSLMKGSFSCPQECKFCISRQFNSCVYAEREIDRVVEEIIGLDNDKIFFVDDDFLVNKERVEAICKKLIARKCFKTIMVFARADSIVNCEDIMPLLYQAGFRDMLVGLEAVEDSTLEKYNKNSSVLLNRQAVKILRDHHMVCVGLFVINYDFRHKDFMNINRFIREEKLIWVLFSILIPFKGTPVYEENKEKLVRYEYKRTGGTSVLIRPEHLPAWLFKMEYDFLYYVNYPRIYLAGLRGTFNKEYAAKKAVETDKGSKHERKQA